MKAKLEYEQVSKSLGLALFLVKQDGVVLGFVRQGKKIGQEIFPYQAFAPKFVAGSHPQVGRLLGSFYENEGGSIAAIHALRKAL